MAKRFSAEQKTKHMDYGAAAFWKHREQFHNFHWNTWSSSFLLLYPEHRAAAVEHYGE